MPTPSTSPTKSVILDAALSVFREQGYSSATLDQIAERAKTAPGELRAHYADKGSLLSALLAQHSPLDDLLTALDAVEGDSAEDILRDAMRRMVKVFQQDELFVELAAIDIQFNNGAFVSNINTQVLPKALTLLERLKATGELRPVSDPI